MEQQSMSQYAETWRKAADMWWREYEAQKMRTQLALEQNEELKAEVAELKEEIARLKAQS